MEEKSSKKPAETDVAHSACLLLLLLSFLAYFSILKMEAICFTGTSVDFHWAIRRYNPQDNSYA
jgi:hypothetical protein